MPTGTAWQREPESRCKGNSGNLWQRLDEIYFKIEIDDESRKCGFTLRVSLYRSCGPKGGEEWVSE